MQCFAKFAKVFTFLMSGLQRCKMINPKSPRLWKAQFYSMTWTPILVTGPSRVEKTGGPLLKSPSRKLLQKHGKTSKRNQTCQPCSLEIILRLLREERRRRTRIYFVMTTMFTFSFFCLWLLSYLMSSPCITLNLWIEHSVL